MFQDCENAEELAIERAAEIERLRAALAKSVELWPAALVRAEELAAQVAALTEENARFKAALERIANQVMPFSGSRDPDWKHWREIASETLEPKP